MPARPVEMAAFKRIGQVGLIDLDFPFSGGVIHLNEILRVIKGKRLVAKGTWNGRTVIIKIFISGRAKKHAAREIKGVELIQQAKIQAPELLASGVLFEGKTYWLVFEWIPSAISIETIWQGGNVELLRPVVLAMQAIIVKLHLYRLIHADLHPHNFILNENGLYLIDVAEVRRFGFFRPITFSRCVTHLVTLYAQLAVRYKALIHDLFERYCQSRGLKLTRRRFLKMQKALLLARYARIKETVWRSYRSCSDVIYFRSRCERYACQRAYFSEPLKAFFRNPDAFIRDQDMIKKGNSCTVARLNFSEVPLLVKRYNIKSWRHGLKKSWYLSRAARSWQNAHVLLALGMNTAKPIAFYEKRFLWLFHGKSYFLCEFQPGETLNHYLKRESDGEMKNSVAERIRQLLTSFSDAGIIHGDLKYTNLIIYNRQPVIVDLDSLRFYYRSSSFSEKHTQDTQRFLNNWPEGDLDRERFKELAEVK